MSSGPPNKRLKQQCLSFVRISSSSANTPALQNNHSVDCVSVSIPLHQSKGFVKESSSSVLDNIIVDSECVSQQPLDFVSCTDIASILDENIFRKMSDLEKVNFVNHCL